MYVLLEDGEPPTNRDELPGEPSDQYERVEDLREQVAYLREQLDREREARTEERRRADTILAQLSAANAEQARTIRQLEAPASPPEARESPVSPGPSESPTPAGGEAQEATEGAETGDTRPWWRRWLK